MTELYDQIVALLPTESSDNLYDTYDKYVEIAKLFESIANEYFEKADAILSDLITAEIPDDHREIVFPVTQKRVVDIAKLRENEDLYNKMAFIPANDAVNIIGRSTIRSMIEEKLKSATDGMITANVTELEKVLGKSSAAKYMTVESKRSENPIVVEKNSYPKDHYKLGAKQPTVVLTSNLNEKAPKAISKLKF